MPAATRTTTGAAHSIVLATSARFRLVPTFFFDGGAAETPSAETPSAGVPVLFFFAMRSHDSLGNVQGAGWQPLKKMCLQKCHATWAIR